MADALKLPFAGEEIVRRVSASNNDPDWLLADRLAGLAAYNELPVETNPLFTLYVDLRAGAAHLPDSDKFAQFARSHYALGLLVHVPRNVVLEQPIVVRWSAGKPGRALISRSVIHIGENAHARILEEQIPSEAHDAASEAQSMWWGTSEVSLAQGAQLSFAGQQDFGAHRSCSSIATPRSAGTPTCVGHWPASAARFHKSRVDNRLIGDRSSVEQVEIVFGDADPALRPDQLHHPPRPGHDRRPAQQGRLPQGRRAATFKGLITIEKSAVQGTDSFLGEFGMLLSKHARAVAIPSLEIDQPDCRRAATRAPSGRSTRPSSST
jgi:Fe-S cluster assembly protein SufB